MISNLILYASTLIEVIRERIICGFSTLPTVEDCIYAIVLILVYALIAIPFGFWQNFLKFDVQFSLEIALKIMTTSLIAPAILEELFFRVILLPHPSEKFAFQIVFVWSFVSLFLFIVYHPLNGVTFFPAGRETFLNPIFLCLAALLGLICTIAYFKSGSIWIPVIIHWLTVVIWLLYLGGMKKLKLIKPDI